MSWVAAAIGGGALLGAGASLYASNKQSDASANALAQQNQMYKQTQADLAPYKKVGSGALISLGQLYGIGADGKPTGQPYNPQALEAFKNSPDYKFAFDQGMQGLTFSNAAKGLLQSGSNLKDIVGFGQGLASQQFGKYVDRLSGLAGMGQNSAAGGATNALGFAGAMGGTTLAGGQAAASGAVGAANALTGGVGSYLNYNQQQQNNTMLANALGNKTVGGSNAVGSIPPTDWAGGGPLGYADGGRPPVGRPVMVGERGPEAFVPDDQNQDYGRGGESPWHGNGWQGGPGMPPNGLAAFSGLRGLPGGQPNGLANAWGGWANMLRPLNGGQPNGLMTASQGFGRPMMGGLPGFADGGRPPTGEPIIVGENGPEVVQMDQPGTVVPNHELPSWMNADTLSQTPYSPPMTRAVDDYSTRDPNELAMMRMRGSVRPDAGRADFPINHLANMALTAGGVAAAPAALTAASYMAPEALFARAAMAAPRATTAAAAVAGAGTATSAGEQEFQWTDQKTDRIREMADIQRRIDERAAQITKLGTTKTNSPVGTQAKVIEQLTKLNNPDSPDVSRLVALRDEAAKERDSAFEQFQYEQERARNEAAARKRAETSWFDVVPGSRSAISAAIPFASYYGGKYLGKRLPVVGAMAAGGIGGGLEGALSQYIPTEVDLGLPRTAPARADAVNDLADPAYWNRMAAVSGGNALLGAYGGFRGAMSRRLPLPPIGPGSAPNMQPVAPPPLSSMGTIPPGPPNGLAAASQALPSPQTSNALANLMTVKDKNGRTIYMNRGGGFANKADIDRYLNSKASQ